MILDELIMSTSKDEFYKISYEDIWVFVKICKIIEFEKFKETGLEALPKILALYDLEDDDYEFMEET